ncbi:hypothetical protein, partial [Photobacterium phosphoreum]|uniref:hypothetical protein n=1 Tax=Photobacterium phosphoreum TaxID=659 RepID=UPI000D4E4A18
NEECLNQVVATCIGINNIGKYSKGFVLIGIGDTELCANRIKDIYNVESIGKNGFYINGIDHEAIRLFGSLDEYFSAIKDKIQLKSFNESLKQQILKDIKMCDYDGHHLIKIEIKSVGEVCSLDENVYLRQGTSTTNITQNVQKIIELTKNYNNDI